jgi:MFS family permease
MQQITAIPGKHFFSLFGYIMFLIGLVIYSVGVILSYISTYSSNPSLGFFAWIFYVLYVVSWLFVCSGGAMGFTFLMLLFFQRAEYRRFILIMGIFGWILVALSVCSVILAFVGKLWGFGVGYGVWIFVVGFATGLVMIIYLFVIKPSVPTVPLQHDFENPVHDHPVDTTTEHAEHKEDPFQ